MPTDGHPHSKSSCTAEADPAPRPQQCLARVACTPATTLFTPQSSCGPAVQELHSQALPIPLHTCSHAVGVSFCIPTVPWRRQRSWKILTIFSHTNTPKPLHRGSQEQRCTLNQFKRQLLSPTRCKQHWLGLHRNLQCPLGTTESFTL